jgi:hypothetical protein
MRGVPPRPSLAGSRDAQPFDAEVTASVPVLVDFWGALVRAVQVGRTRRRWCSTVRSSAAQVPWATRSWTARRTP